MTDTNEAPKRRKGPPVINGLAVPEKRTLVPGKFRSFEERRKGSLTPARKKSMEIASALANDGKLTPLEALMDVMRFYHDEMKGAHARVEIERERVAVVEVATPVVDKKGAQTGEQEYINPALKAALAERDECAAIVISSATAAARYMHSSMQPLKKEDEDGGAGGDGKPRRQVVIVFESDDYKL